SSRSKLQTMRSADTRETMIPVRSLTDLGLQPGRVVVELLPFTDGNPTPVELFCLGALVRASGARAIFEIGTFDGTTTLQLALNSPDNAVVWTLAFDAAGCRGGFGTCMGRSQRSAANAAGADDSSLQP